VVPPVATGTSDSTSEATGGVVTVSDGPTTGSEATTGAEEETVEGEEVVHTTRYFKLKNNTTEKLTVYLQYRTVNDEEAWLWLPGDPDAADADALVFELEPGEETYLEDDEWTINASRVRFWAVSATGVEWNKYQSEDLWLVPEMDAEGTHVYTAKEMGTFRYVFGK
jgi:hypothetical protein